MAHTSIFIRFHIQNICVSVKYECSTNSTAEGRKRILTSTGLIGVFLLHFMSLSGLSIYVSRDVYLVNEQKIKCH